MYYLYHCIYKPQPDFWNSFVPALHWFLYYMPILCIKVYSSFVKGMKKFCIDFDSFVIAMQVFHSQRHPIFLKIVLVFGNVPKKESLKKFRNIDKSGFNNWYLIKKIWSTFWMGSLENEKMLFCYQNCSDLLWEKIVLVIEKNFWNSRLKAENFQKFWDHLNNLFKQWKVRTIFGNRMLF